MRINDETEYSILRRAEDMLDTKLRWNIKDDEMTGYVDEDAYSLIDDLCSKIDELQEQIEDMEENIRENYKPISPYEFYGVNEHDF